MHINAHTKQVKTDEDLEQIFRAYLDDVYGTVRIAGITFDANRVLRQLDPISYQVAYNDWRDREGWVDEDDWHEDTPESP